MKRRTATAIPKPTRERRALDELRRAAQRSKILQDARLASNEAAFDLLTAVRAYLRAIGHDIPKLREPSAASLREMPEINFDTTKTVRLGARKRRAHGRNQNP